MFKSDRNRYSLIFPLFFYSSRASEKAGRIYSCALRLNPHSAARRFQFSRTVFRISDAIAVASLVLISQYGAISSARSREIVASSSFTQRDSSSPSGTGVYIVQGREVPTICLEDKAVVSHVVIRIGNSHVEHDPCPQLCQIFLGSSAVRGIYRSMP